MSGKGELQEYLDILFHSPDIRQPWKDVVSDWIIDQHQRGSLTEATLLRHLRGHFPSVYFRLANNPQVRDRVLAIADI